jgi:hypothetical protein
LNPYELVLEFTYLTLGQIPFSDDFARLLVGARAGNFHLQSMDLVLQLAHAFGPLLPVQGRCRALIVEIPSGFA